jgi:hypothetical protein
MRELAAELQLLAAACELTQDIEAESAQPLAG